MSLLTKRFSRWWDRQFEDGDPDCRLRPFDRDKAKVRIGRMEWDTVFCASCGKAEGAATPDAPFVFYLCNACAEKNGPPPGMVEVKAPGA